MVEDVFDVWLKGDIQGYDEGMMEELRECVKEEDGDICVMEVWMVEGGKEVEEERGVWMIDGV
ncbi:hypothetical protein [Bacillus altitudinis]|uniref:hypothetical protein n=1 Tax=Bacillus altitudinis TaxID=293387 RepID=UPI0011A89034|nr:hypothetical protein [Bacillus altitudinis]